MLCLFLEIVAIILGDVLSKYVCVFIICQAHFYFVHQGLMYSEMYSDIKYSVEVGTPV